MVTARERPLIVPSAGVIRGGLLDEWHYHLLHFRAAPRALVVVARCVPNGWPFPRDIPLAPEHFRQLRAIPGERAKRVAAEPLIAYAYRLAGLQMPQWMVDRRMTLYALVKRAHQSTAKAVPQ